MSAYFILMPGTWDSADRHLCRPLIGSRETRDTQTPWVTVATGVTDGQYDLIARTGPSPEAARQQIAEAQRHLELQPVTWQVTEKRGLLLKKPWIVRAMITSMRKVPTLGPMDDLSSELLLHSAALTEASRVVNSRELVVIVPKRGWLLAGAGGAADWPARKYMLDAATGVFGRATAQQGISPYVFHWQNGQVTGYEATEGQGGYLSLQQAQESEWLI
ncbi:MAG: hypothetical protein H7Z41_16520 [Cytophagales bacterium]|nr:hypothetical protein [Armatimonadota bacterium]